MAESIPTASTSACPTDCARTYAYWTLRVWLGVRALLSGLEKFTGKVATQQPLLDEFGQPDLNGTMVAVERKVYGFEHYAGLPKSLAEKFAAEPLLPAWLLQPYIAALGYVLIALGLLLFLGVASRLTLLALGLLYTSLTVGLILINENTGVALLGLHVLLVAAALVLVKHDRFCLTRSL
jgi:thiosulfate dehydrogenase (quinone) large subunit